MTTPIYWDTGRLPENRLLWMTDLVADKETANNGVSYAMMTDGGGLWTCSMTVKCRKTIESGYALSMITRADGGATPFILPNLAAFNPYPNGTPAADTGFDDETTFDDGTDFADGGIHVVLAVAAAARDIYITVNPLVWGAWKGVADFSVDYPTMGRHMHRVVGYIDNEDGSYRLEIRPPWREAVATTDPAALLDFNAPSCTMTLSSDPKSSIEQLQRPTKTTLTLTFSEYFE